MLTQEQQLAVNTVDENVLVSAGAGSGKTHVLVERYVEILRRYPDVSLANIIAVTYTKKAAAEMRSRLKSKFLSLSRDAREAGLDMTERWRQAMLEVDSARIGTIHSLCESILKAFPGDCGIDPQYKVVEDLDQAQMIKESIDYAWKEVIVCSQSEDAATRESYENEHMLLLEFNIQDVEKWITKMIRASIQLKQTLKLFGIELVEDSRVFVPVDTLRVHAGDVLAQVKLQVLGTIAQSDLLKRHVRDAATSPYNDAKRVLEGMRDQIIALHQRATDEALTVDDRWQAVLEQREFKVGNVGSKTQDAADLKAALKGIKTLYEEISDGVPATLNEADERGFACVAGLLGMFQIAYWHYHRAKAKRTVLDYDDLIGLTIKSLETPLSRSRAFFKERIKALLVDEFQDTNDMQAGLLSLLAGDDTRLFLIGDDKQSIYKFQGADVATFNKYKSQFGDRELEEPGKSRVTKLTSSFRSHPHVVGFVNAIFRRLFDRDPRVLPYVAGFEALNPARQSGAQEPTLEESAAAKPRVEVLLYQRDDEPCSDKVYEARQVARWILQKVDDGVLFTEKAGKERPLRFGDFAVLLNRNADFAQFEQVFAAFGIPYVSSGGAGFLRRQEVLDFECMLRFLDNPQDSHSLLAVLRSPFCAITDDIIHKICLEGDKASLWSKLLQASASTSRRPGYESVSKAVQTLRILLEQAALLPLPQLLHNIVTRTAYDICMLAAPDGRQRSRNVWKIVYLSAKDDGLSCGEFAHKLSLMREFNSKQSEAPLDSGDSVKIMTVHGSKGLEFPVVALPCLSGAVKGNFDKLVYQPGYGIAFNTARSKDDEKPGWYQVAGYLERQMDMEERKRLFYVAVTRARDFLGLFLKRDGNNFKNYRLLLLQVLGLDSKDPSLLQLTEGLPMQVDGVPLLLTFMANPNNFFEGREIDKQARQVDGEPSKDSNIATGANTTSGELLLDQEWAVEYPKINEEGLSRITVRAAESAAAGLSSLPHRELFTAKFLGVFFHALMEHLPNARSFGTEDAARLTRYIGDIAGMQSFHLAHGAQLARLVEEGERLMKVYYDSRLCELVNNSTRRFHESSFLISQFDSYKNYRPDMIFAAENGDWYIVDFKTDRLNEGAGDEQANIEKLAQRHSEQVLTYSRHLEKLSGLKFKAHIYFAQKGLLFPV